MIRYKSWAIPEGNVVKVTDESGAVIWALQNKSTVPAVLTVEKITSDTYAGSTTYTGESFALLDIYPKSASSTVKVTYGGLTKTLTFTGTNAQTVYFGTFNGVTDSVTTPASGTLTIEGDYRGFASGTYSKYNATTTKSQTAYSSCVTSVVDWGSLEYLPSYAFQDCAKLTAPNLPSGVTSIPSYAFYGCSNIAFTSLPSAITSIGTYAFYQCANLAITSLPSGVTSIGTYAFYECKSINIREIPSGVTSIADYTFAMYATSYVCETAMNGGTMTLPSGLTSIGKYALCSHNTNGTGYEHIKYLYSVNILATTPPTLGTTVFGGADDGSYVQCPQLIVPKGCGDTYKSASGWSVYANYIVEAS